MVAHKGSETDHSYLGYESIQRGILKNPRARRFMLVPSQTISVRAESAMSPPAEGPTSSSLLGEVADWENHQAWNTISEPVRSSHPRLVPRPWTSTTIPSTRCAAHLDQPGPADENLPVRRQQRSFGAGSSASANRGLSTSSDGASLSARSASTMADATSSLPRRTIMRTPTFPNGFAQKAEKVQAAVKARVKPGSWEAFWLVCVYDQSVDKTARDLRMTRIAVYAATARVARMLCEEGKRVLDQSSAGRGRR